MNILKLLAVFVTAFGLTVGALELGYHKSQTEQPIQQPDLDIDLEPPPPQYQYLRVMPGSPLYHRLPTGLLPIYYASPQLFFYHEPCKPFYQPGVSRCLGHGWWYTPGCGLINIGYYHERHPFNCPQHPKHEIIKSQTNISNIHSTINPAKIPHPEHHTPVQPHHQPHPQTPPRHTPQPHVPQPHHQQPAQPHTPPHHTPSPPPHHTPSPSPPHVAPSPPHHHR